MKYYIKSKPASQTPKQVRRAAAANMAVSSVLSRLVSMVAGHINEDSKVLVASVVDLMVEFGIDRQAAKRLSFAVVDAVKSDDGLSYINDMWHACELAGQDQENPDHEAYYWKRAAREVVRHQSCCTECGSNESVGVRPGKTQCGNCGY